MKKKILVTGGAGFIGSNFCNINREKFDIVALDNLFLGDPDNLHPDVKFMQGSACNEEDLEKCLEMFETPHQQQPHPNPPENSGLEGEGANGKNPHRLAGRGAKIDAVLHLAGTSSAPMFAGENYVAGYLNSTESFLHTIEFARKCGAKRFLYASTSSIYGNQELPLSEDKPVFPTNHYSVSKLFYENACTAYHQNYPEMETVGFRFMSVYGPNEEAKGEYANLISQFIWDFSRGNPPIIYGDGTQTRDFTNVADIVQGITLAIESRENLGSTVFNIGRGESTSLNEMIKIIKKYLETDLEPKYIPNPVKENYIRAQHADISKISRVLGFKPRISLDEGIRLQIENLRPEKIRGTSSDKIVNN